MPSMDEPALLQQLIRDVDLLKKLELPDESQLVGVYLTQADYERLRGKPTGHTAVAGITVPVRVSTFIERSTYIMSDGKIRDIQLLNREEPCNVE